MSLVVPSSPEAALGPQAKTAEALTFIVFALFIASSYATTAVVTCHREL
jgi:hypothetical protein